MREGAATYPLSRWSILVVLLLSVFISTYFKWSYAEYPLNFMGGDAKDYYSPLRSIFITHDFLDQQGNDWFLLKTGTGTVNVHPVGVSVLLLPFFLLAMLCARLFGFPVDGYSFPFQVSVAFAALAYAVLGLLALRSLLKKKGFSDLTGAVVLLLLFFGTNLLHYTVSEAGMSHVYSFALISAFMLFSYRLASMYNRKDLLLSSLCLGLIVLVRPNNVLILLIFPAWFNSWKDFTHFMGALFRRVEFYLALALAALIAGIQSLVWWLQSGKLMQDTYKADGFYWTRPELLKMLFGFDNGFFIYTPVCFLLLTGLFFVFRQSRYRFVALSFFLLGIFYFFSCYWAYTYFDGLGIRVLVDYYAVFGLIGASLFERARELPLAMGLLGFAVSGLFVINLVYCYQANRGILLRTGMTYEKWRYVFMRTSPQYINVLGGSNELEPYSPLHPEPAIALSDSALFAFEGREYGLVLGSEALGFDSNRLHLKIECTRREAFQNASAMAFICVSVTSASGKKNKGYLQFRMNQTPSRDCCEAKTISYTANLSGEFNAGDRLSVYVWNPQLQPFSVEEFKAKVYNYNYSIHT